MTETPSAPASAGTPHQLPARGHDSSGPAPVQSLTSRSGLSVQAGLLASLMVASVVSPLLVLYQQRNGFGDVTLTVAFALYAVGVVLGLQLTARLTDAAGPRAVLLPALALAAVALVVLLVSQSLTALILARIVSGLAAGMVNQAAGAAILGMTGGNAATSAAVTASLANGGLGLGPLLGGVLALWGNALITPIAVLLALVVVVGCAQRWGPTGGSGAGVSFRPVGVALPAHGRRAFLQGVLGASAAFAVGGFVPALAPTLLGATLGLHSTALSGATVFLFFACTPPVVFAMRRVTARGKCLAGLPVLVVGVGLVLAALFTESLALMLLSMVVAGTGLAATFAGGLEMIEQGSDPAERGRVLGLTYTLVYAAFVLPSIGFSLISTATSTVVAAIAFTLVIAALCAASATSLLRSPARSGSPP